MIWRRRAPSIATDRVAVDITVVSLSGMEVGSNVETHSLQVNESAVSISTVISLFYVFLGGELAEFVQAQR